MIYQIFTTLLKWKTTRRLLQWAKQRKIFQLSVPMLREWYEKDFCFQYPHLSLLGCETLVEFGFVLEKWNIHHPLIITDQTLIKTGVVDQVTSQLKKHKIKFQIYDGVQPNPSTNVVNGVVKACHKHECDALISVGGGSAHDAAKGASLILSNNHPLKKFQGLNVSKNAAKLPIIAVNTTAGTGAGATNAAVITDEQSHFKMTLTDKNIQPHILVDDSDLMIGLPVRSSMWTGIDTLVHAIEADLSIYTSYFTKTYARQCMRMVYRYLPIVHQKSTDKEAREKMAYAEFLGGIAFNSSSLGFIHSLSHAMSGVFNTPHGLANAVLMPYVLDYELKYPKVVSRIAKIGDYMHINLPSEDELGKAKDTVRAIITFTKKIDIPTNLAIVQPQITSQQIRQMAKKAMKDFCGISNPIQFSKRQITHIYQNAIAGKFDNI